MLPALRHSSILACRSFAVPLHGQPDLYPFVLSVPAIDKLRQVRALVHDALDAAAAGGLSSCPSNPPPSLTERHPSEEFFLRQGT
jgi:hypothetical protein